MILQMNSVGMLKARASTSSQLFLCVFKKSQSTETFKNNGQVYENLRERSQHLMETNWCLESFVSLEKIRTKIKKSRSDMARY